MVTAISAVAPTANVPSGQVSTAPARLQLPVLGSAPMGTTPPGSVSVTTTRSPPPARRW